MSRKRPGSPDAVLTIGEAKGTATPLSESELNRLEHLRDLIPDNRVDAPPRLLLFSRSGFTAGLRQAAVRPDVELVDLMRLYQGD